VIVVYYKRRDTIEKCLDSIFQQDYMELEVIVVDNHAQGDLRQITQARGYEVNLIEPCENLGACGGRNAGIRAAHGEILVFLDDDVSFASAFELSKIVRAFDRRPDAHVLAFRICDPETGEIRQREWCHTRPWQEFRDTSFETIWFGEGASAFRQQVFAACGHYYEPLFYGAEGHDLVLRLLDRGFRMVYAPEIRVSHWASEKGRTAARQYYYYTRNFIWMAVKDYPLWDGLIFLVPKILMMLYFSWRSSTYRPFFGGMWDGLKGLRRIWPDRRPVRRSTLGYVDQQENWRPGFMVRLARHRHKPLI
jgi:GT2 family glycosyltransferase